MKKKNEPYILYYVDPINKEGQCPNCGEYDSLQWLVVSKNNHPKGQFICDKCLVKETNKLDTINDYFNKRKKRRKKLIICLSLFFALILTFEAFGAFSNWLYQENSEFAFYYGYNVNTETPETTRYCYKRLNSNSQEIYISILNNAYICSDDMNIEGYSQEDIHNAFYAFCCDYPEYFWYCQAMDYYDGDEYSYTRIIDCDVSEYEVQEFRNQVNEIVHNASVIGDDFNRIKYIYDWITNYVYFDYGMIDQTDDRYFNEMSKEERNTWTAYGAIVNKRAVCGGIAKTFELLVQQLGYECGYVSGVTNDGERHAWNVVIIDGNEYFFDATWDCRNKKNNIPTYNYFFVTKEELYRSRTEDPFYHFDNTNDYGVIGLNDYDFFIYNDYYLNTYSLDYVKEKIDDQYMNECVYLKFSSELEFDRAFNDIDVIIQYFCKVSDVDEYSYMYDDYMYTLVLYK